jgi:hypothetical protein
VAVFSVEKLVYTFAWAYWLATNTEKLQTLKETSPQVALFFMTYGAGDFLFCIFFGAVAVSTYSGKLRGR